MKKLFLLLASTGTLLYAQQAMHNTDPDKPTPEEFRKIAANFNPQNTDFLTLELLIDLGKDAPKNNPFYLAVIPVGNTFNYFSAQSLADTFEKKGNFLSPTNRQPVKKIVIYKYDAKKGTKAFPFHYVQTLTERLFCSDCQTTGLTEFLSYGSKPILPTPPSPRDNDYRLTSSYRGHDYRLTSSRGR